MFKSWKEWEGQTIDGKFPLIAFVGESEHSVVFLTERQAGGVTVPAAIKIVPAGTDHGEPQLDKWRQTAELSHPHMIRLYEMGRCEVGGIEAIYLVMERAEENLAQIVPDRALAADEARAVLDSVVDVLAYLHAKGFVHGRIKPSNIMASGNELKVSSDALSRAGDNIDRRGDANAYDPPEYKPSVIAVPQSMAPSGDIWSLGMALVEVLTKVLPLARTDEQQNPQVPQTVPKPFLDIANHCLVRHPQGRWTAAQIADCLKGRMAVPVPQPARPESPKASAPLVSPQPTPPIQPHVRPAVSEPVREPAKRPSFAVPVAVLLAVLLAAVVFGVKFFRDHSQPTSAPSAFNVQDAVPVASAPPAASAAKLETAPPLKHQQVGSDHVLSDDGPNSKAPVPIHASIHPAAAPEAESRSVANLFTPNPLRGEVAHQVMPELQPAARNSIQGTVQVIVNVNVDHEGNVEDAELAMQGPSKYFDRQALKAARLWKFNPPRIGNQGVLSSWRLQFEFTRGGAKAIPTQEMP